MTIAVVGPKEQWDFLIRHLWMPRINLRREQIKLPGGTILRWVQGSDSHRGVEWDDVIPLYGYDEQVVLEIQQMVSNRLRSRARREDEQE